jgi:hypothetical protein
LSDCHLQVWFVSPWLSAAGRELQLKNKVDFAAFSRQKGKLVKTWHFLDKKENLIFR